MARYYFTTQDLINSVKRRANIPDSQAMISDQEIIDFANEEMESNIVPLIVAKHEDYFMIREDIPIVLSQREYPIPYRAFGSKLRKVCVSDDGIDLGQLNRVRLEDLVEGNLYTGSEYRYYHIEGENIVLGGTDTVAANYLTFFYNLKPNSLVDSERVGIITQIDRVNGIIALAEMPEHFDTSYQYDMIKTRAPHKIITFDIDLANIDIANKLLTFDPADIPDQLMIGDRIAIAGETDVINCPSELHVMLAQAVAARVLEANGDSEGLVSAEKKLKKMEDTAGNILDNRVSGAPLKAKPFRRYRRFNR